MDDIQVTHFEKRAGPETMHGHGTRDASITLSQLEPLMSHTMYTSAFTVLVQAGPHAEAREVHTIELDFQNEAIILKARKE